MEQQSEKILKEKGFSNKEEFFQMVGQLNLRNLHNRIMYLDWEAKDGSKEGLQKLLYTT